MCAERFPPQDVENAVCIQQKGSVTNRMDCQADHIISSPATKFQYSGQLGTALFCDEHEVTGTTTHAKQCVIPDMLKV